MKMNCNQAMVEEPEPAWEVARLFPPQGSWTKEDYLGLDTKHFVELSQGRIDVLPMPTTSHQRTLGFLSVILRAFATEQDLGEALIGPLPIRILPREFREPDIMFVLTENGNLVGKRFLKGADLVMEIVSPGSKNRRRDLKDKRRDYAKAGIPEYWIIDPRDERITVLRLAEDSYLVHGEFSRGETASSCLLMGFTVDVSATFDRQNPDDVKPAKAKRRPKA